MLRVQVAELLPRLRVELEDERLTSVAAEAEMREHGLRWWQVPKGQIDTSAVRILLGASSNVKANLALMILAPGGRRNDWVSIARKRSADFLMSRLEIPSL